MCPFLSACGRILAHSGGQFPGQGIFRVIQCRPETSVWPRRCGSRVQSAVGEQGLVRGPGPQLKAAALASISDPRGELDERRGRRRVRPAYLRRMKGSDCSPGDGRHSGPTSYQEGVVACGRVSLRLEARLSGSAERRSSGQISVSFSSAFWTKLYRCFISCVMRTTLLISCKIKFDNIAITFGNV